MFWMFRLRVQPKRGQSAQGSETTDQSTREEVAHGDPKQHQSISNPSTVGKYQPPPRFPTCARGRTGPQWTGSLVNKGKSSHALLYKTPSGGRHLSLRMYRGAAGGGECDHPGRLSPSSRKLNIF